MNTERSSSVIITIITVRQQVNYSDALSICFNNTITDFTPICQLKPGLGKMYLCCATGSLMIHKLTTCRTTKLHNKNNIYKNIQNWPGEIHFLKFKIKRFCKQ